MTAGHSFAWRPKGRRYIRIRAGRARGCEKSALADHEHLAEVVAGEEELQGMESLEEVLNVAVVERAAQRGFAARKQLQRVRALDAVLVKIAFSKAADTLDKFPRD